jgi:hypothetical protein
VGRHPRRDARRFIVEGHVVLAHLYDFVARLVRREHHDLKTRGLVDEADALSHLQLFVDAPHLSYSFPKEMVYPASRRAALSGQSGSRAGGGGHQDWLHAVHKGSRTVVSSSSSMAKTSRMGFSARPPQ